MFWRQRFHHLLLLFQLVHTRQSSFASTGGWEQNFAIGNFFVFLGKKFVRIHSFSSFPPVWFHLHLSLQVDDNWQTLCNPTFSNHPSCPQLLSSDAALLRLRVKPQGRLVLTKILKNGFTSAGCHCGAQESSWLLTRTCFPSILHSCLTCPTPVSTRLSCLNPTLLSQFSTHLTTTIILTGHHFLRSRQPDHAVNIFSPRYQTNPLPPPLQFLPSMMLSPCLNNLSGQIMKRIFELMQHSRKC